MSTFYIPPEGLRFRLVGYVSQCAIFSRNDPEPHVYHYNVSNGDFPDQWFTLLHGSEKRSGQYAIKGGASGKVLFCRGWHPTVGHIEGDGVYDDNWFKIEPSQGQYAGYFRLITPSEGLTFYSRSSPEPPFGNYTINDFWPDQLFGFWWEPMKVDKIEYNLDAGKIITSTPVVLVAQDLENSSDREQGMSISVNQSVTHSSTFEYSSGFTVTAGTEMNVGIPVIAEGKFSVSALNIRSSTWGNSTEFNTQYAATFLVKAGPRTSVHAVAVVNFGRLEVPYTIYMSSRSSGVKVQTSGVWSGTSSWDMRYTITPFDVSYTRSSSP